MSTNVSIIQKSLLKKIADSIRVKTGLTRQIEVTEYPSLIRQIDGSSSGDYDVSLLQYLLGRSLITDLTTTDFTIPEGVEKIGTGAFNNLTMMTSITLPSTLTYMRGNSSVFVNCSALKEITFLGDWNTNIVAPNLANVETIYCHSWYYDKFKATSASYYISSKLKCLHDTDLTELLVEGFHSYNSYERGETSQLTLSYNKYDCAYDEQRGVTWSIVGEGATITQSGFLKIDEDATYDTTIKVVCTSKYDPSIVFEKELKILKSISIYDYGAESEEYKLTQQNSGVATVTRNIDNLTISTSSGVYADLTTLNKVDLTNFTEVLFYGKINSPNPENGFMFVTNDATVKHNSTNRVKGTQLQTKLEYYSIDVSDLEGEYYIGFSGSNRTVTCYQLKVV